MFIVICAASTMCLIEAKQVFTKVTWYVCRFAHREWQALLYVCAQLRRIASYRKCMLQAQLLY